jgi:outer membrane protein assembly factor BamD (BamD/ComL family)
MTREEHIAWCKLRGLAELSKGQIQNALEGFVFDMNKHPQTQMNSAIVMIALHIVEKQNANEAKAFIERFT